MIVFDTSFLYAYFESTDVHHKTALKMAEGFGGKSLILPIEVFEELMTVATRKIGSEDAALWGKALLDTDGPVELLRSADNIFKNAWANFQALGSHSFSFVDCILIALSKELACPILTFDKALNEHLENLQ